MLGVGRRGFAAMACVFAVVFLPGTLALGADGVAPVRIALDDAIKLALQHNEALKAARTTIVQNQHQETTAGLRPNPGFSASFAPLPLFSPQGGLKNYLKDTSGLDFGLSYTIERGGKRGDRVQAAKDTTAVTRSQVADNERTLTLQVATQFINVQLAESTLDLVST
jgi:cobalt-zinc-cadmium efflux system outer membrane protein